MSLQLKRVRNKPNKSKLTLYKLLLHFSSCLKQLQISNKTEHFSYRGGCVIHEHTCIKALKEELGLTTDKRLHVISNIMLFETITPVRIILF